MSSRAASVLSALVLSCGPVTPPAAVINYDPVPIALSQLSYVQPITLSNLLDENSAVRRAEHALLLLSSDWCKHCSRLSDYFEGMAEYVQRQGLTSEQLYFARLAEEFNGDLNGLLPEEVWNFPAVVYLQAEEGSPNREAGMIGPGTAWDDLLGAIPLVELRILFLARGIISQYN